LREKLRSNTIYIVSRDFIVVSHEAVVTSVDAASGYARVRVSASSDECGACAAAAICGAGKGEELTVPIGGFSLRPGQRLTLAADKNTHKRAVWLMLILPWIALVSVITVALCILHLSEGVSVCAGFGAMFVTYVIVHRYTRTCRQSMTFSVMNLHGYDTIEGGMS